MRKLIFLISRILTALKGWIKSNRFFNSYFQDLQNMRLFENKLDHEIMLADKARVDQYHAGITRNVKPGDLVVDLGTGTGILAYFAAKNAQKVHAIEHSGIINLARKVAAENKVDNVEFHHCTSRDFELEEKVDAIVHEQIGNFVFEENMIENILDLRRRVLKPGGRILPNRFEIFIEPLEMKEECHRPYLWELNLHGITYKTAQDMVEGRPGQGQLLTNYNRQKITVSQVKHLLCDLKPIIEFDLETMGENDLPSVVHYENRITKAGKIHGLWVGFRTYFDDQVCLSVTPQDRHSSWVFHLFRLEECEVEVGDKVAYDLTFGDHRDYATWRLDWHEPEKSAEEEEGPIASAAG